MRLWRRVLGPAALVLAPVACRQILGIEEREDEQNDAGATGACPNVLPFPVSDSCRGCLQDQCCPEGAACAREPACVACTLGQDSCTSPPASFLDLETCIEDSCSGKCAVDAPPGIEGAHQCMLIPVAPVVGECFLVDELFNHAHCNPISNDGCEGPGEVCAFDANLYVAACRVSAHHGTCGEPCGLIGGGCGPGLACVSEAAAIEGVCAHWCCANADCGVAGECEKLLEGFDIGVCVVK